MWGKIFLFFWNLLVLTSGCGPSEEDIYQAMDAVVQGIESIPFERQDFIDGLHGISSSFAIESEEEANDRSRLPYEGV